jgi:hypothetical protein
LKPVGNDVTAGLQLTRSWTVVAVVIILVNIIVLRFASSCYYYLALDKSIYLFSLKCCCSDLPSRTRARARIDRVGKSSGRLCGQVPPSFIVDGTVEGLGMARCNYIKV